MGLRLRSPEFLFVVLAAAAPLACDGRPRASATPVVRDSAGTAIIENASPTWSSRTAWHVSAAPVLRIGSVEGGEPAKLFTFIRGVIRLADGTIVISEGRTN